MPIAVVCPGCKARLNAPDTTVGKTVKCPKCQSPMAVPAAEQDNPFEVVDEPAPPPKKRKPVPDDDEDERPRARKRPVDDDEDEDEQERPRKKTARSKKSAKSGTPMGLLVGGGFAVVLLLSGLAFGVYWFAIREKPQAGGGSGGGGASDGGGGNPSGAGGVRGGKAGVPAGWKEVAPPRAGFKAVFPTVEDNVKLSPVLPAVGSKNPTIANYFGWSADRNLQCTVLVFIYPDGVAPAEREKTLIDRLNAGIPQDVRKETSRGKSTLGGKEATEIVEEVNFAAMMGGKPGPDGQKFPDKLVSVTRYAFSGNRAFAAALVKPNARPIEAEERGFFDNFEILPVAETPKTDGPKPPDTASKIPKSPDDPPSDFTPGPKRPWPYTAASRFQIWFPTASIHNKTKSEIMRQRKLLGSFADCFDVETGLSYHLGYCDFPAGSSDDAKKKLLDEVVGSLSGEGLGSDFVSRRKVTMAGKEWDEIVTKSGESQTVTRSLDTGKSVFAFSMGSKTGLPPADAQKAFFDTFNFQK